MSNPSYSKKLPLKLGLKLQFKASDIVFKLALVFRFRQLRRSRSKRERRLFLQQLKRNASFSVRLDFLLQLLLLFDELDDSHSQQSS